MKKIFSNFKKVIKNIIPEKVLLFYHGSIAYIGAFFYGFPSKHMVVIGVTGTKGKTTTANILFALLSKKYKTGLITTANIKIGEKERLNPWHMTMPGRFVIQQLLAEMKKDGVTHVIIETTSEGLKQKRHYGIYYDIAVFMNLSPEHLPSHNNDYVQYRKAKEVLFDSLGKYKKDQTIRIPSLIVVNGDDKEAPHFLKYEADKKVSFGRRRGVGLRATHIKQEKFVTFMVGNKKYSTNIIGTYGVENMLPVIAIANHLHIEEKTIEETLCNIPVIPGRMESLYEGQDFSVIVDYAHEKLSMSRLSEAVKEMKKEGSKWIVLLGAEGGGRDTRKRKDMGEIVGRDADYIVISNTDPYEEDECAIAHEIASFVKESGKQENVDYFIVIDRREGIRKALSLAKKGDIVTITGNGSQQFYHRKGERVLHDDRVVVRETLHDMGYKIKR